jgi:hypothetical protein
MATIQCPKCEDGEISGHSWWEYQGVSPMGGSVKFFDFDEQTCDCKFTEEENNKIANEIMENEGDYE